MVENEAKDFLGRFSLDRIGYANGKEVDMERFDYFTEVLVTAMKALSEIQKYRAIGTVEECRKAVERQRAKKPIANNEERKIYMCQCGSTRICTMDNFCPICGQAILWERDTD